MKKLFVAVLQWFANWLTPKPAKPQSAAIIPPLPTSTVGAVAGAVTEAGRLVEQQVALHNTAEMQAAAAAQQATTQKSAIEKAVADRDVGKTRELLAE